MEPLTMEQEVLLSSDGKSDNLRGGENEDDSTKQDASSPEDGTGTYKDSSLSSENVDVLNENRVADDSVIRDLSVDDVKYTSDGIDGINNVSIQKDLQHESTSSDMSVEADIVANSFNIFESQNHNDSSIASGFKDLDSNSAVGAAELISELKENPVNVESTNLSVSDDVPSNLSLVQDTVHQTSDHSSVANVPFEPVARNVPSDSQSNTILEEHIASTSNIATLSSSSTNENFELSNISQVSAEESRLTLEVPSVSEGGSSGVSLSSAADSSQNEKYTKSHNDRSTSESPKAGTSFSSAGIPAPSEVFSALQVLPGKVLVPAVVDQVQGQALAALQVLKVFSPLISALGYVILSIASPLVCNKS